MTNITTRHYICRSERHFCTCSEASEEKDLREPVFFVCFDNDLGENDLEIIIRHFPAGTHAHPMSCVFRERE